MGLLQVSVSVSGQKRHSQDIEAVGTLGQISNKSTTDTSPQPPSCALVKRSDIVITTFTVQPAPPVVPIAVDFTLKVKQNKHANFTKTKKMFFGVFFFTYSTLSPLVYPSIVLFSPQSFFFPRKIWLVVVDSRCWVVVARTTVTMAPSWLHRGQLLLPYSQGPAHLQGCYDVRV